MSIVVFTGPTLSAKEGRVELEATFLPPAAAGDLYRASLSKPQAIALVDGYFDSKPAVRHKEILWAMSQGIHVFGCASMGALRAAELAAFGMEGVGAIFEDYLTGKLTDDDEVAIAQGDSENDYAALSEAMVNIRATLRVAESAGVVSARARHALETLAKHLFYPNRSYPNIMRQASNLGLSEEELTRFRKWLPRGKVDQKRRDAVLMLTVIRERVTKGLGPKEVAYRFAHSVMWEELCRRYETADSISTAT